jgi:hypothetical protein
MNQKFGVNYYPGSVGDAFIAHAFPNIEYRFNPKFHVIELLNVFFLKNIDQVSEQIIEDEIKIALENYNIISMHRFNAFDFSAISNFTVISIDPTGVESNIALRNLTQLSLIEKYKDFRKNFMIEKNLKTRIIHFSANIRKWTKEQILDTDKVLSLKLLIDNQNDYFEDWKIKNNLSCLNILSDDFYNHLKKSLNVN